MNNIEMEHLKRITDLCVDRREIIEQQAATIANLTAHNESMQADAVNNTATINMLMAQLAEVNEENRGLRLQLHMEPK